MASTSGELSYKQLEKKIRDAKQAKKIFMVYHGYAPITRALLRRGWLQKVPTEKIQHMGGSTEHFMIANMLKNAPFYFAWQPKSRPVKIPVVEPPTYVNSIYRRQDLDFTSKEGLIHLRENLQWFTIENFAELSVPRTYVLSDREGREDFIRDYKRTNFISFILYLAKKKNFSKLFTAADDGISTNIIDAALAKVDILLRIKSHEDIDTQYLIETFNRFPDGRDVKEVNMRRIMSKSKKFKMLSEKRTSELEELVKSCAEKILDFWPERRYDGFRNLWIVMPIGGSCGHGVTLQSDKQSILKIAMNSSARFIVQKYIERPMLVQSRKFDIRVYFMTLIRDDGFVDLWMYKNCYFKFGTHRFSLDHLDRSIHVTNYTVQKSYMNADDAVTNAVENMWVLKEFQRHLEFIEKPNLWRERIYPAIKQNIMAVLMQSLEVSTLEVNNFELNGADFLLTCDHQPILLEINTKPDLFFSPKVVDLITGQLQEDIVKVLVDFQRDITSSTGDFELVHIFEIPKVESGTMNSLVVDGKKLSVAATVGKARRRSRGSRRSSADSEAGSSRASTVSSAESPSVK